MPTQDKAIAAISLQEKGKLRYLEGIEEKRVANARRAVARYRKLTGCRKKQAIADLLCGGLHLCDHEPEFGNLAWHLSLAYWHYYHQGAPRTCGMPSANFEELYDGQIVLPPYPTNVLRECGKSFLNPER